MSYVILTLLLFILSFLSGMMGLGVAFIATPTLGLFGLDLKHEIMPLSLWLNGITAIASAITLARKGMVDWRTALPLLAITTLVAPIGVWLLQFVPTTTIWWIYVGVLFFLAYRMAFPPPQDDSAPRSIGDDVRVKAGAASAAIGVFAGFLGVGPGFLMMPTLVLLGYNARIAAATNAVIVTLPSFSAFAAHLIDARFDWLLLGLTSVSAVIGAQSGAAFMARRVKSLILTRIFAAALVLLALQRTWSLVVA
ncbi:sulfite exporter TauE/SafE family protein [Roseiflexus castenholzii]|uniref:sulfite exporter TauE/SafE family protein n=1 Tax=Roseiflexus castenholzii TaxID=120962 RepID=UPI003C7E9989